MNAPSNLLEWLASLSFDVAVFVLYVPALLLTVFGTLLVRWLFSDQVAPDSSVGPTKVGFMAQVYSVMLGFLVAATYAQYGETRTWVRQEVESLRLIRNITSDVATPQAEALKIAVSDYARAVVEGEWELLAFGDESPQAEAALASMLTALPDPDPDGSLSTALAVGQLRDLIQNVAIARVERISAAPDRKIANLLSGVLVLITGLAISIAWFLRGPSVVVHLILGGILVTTFLSLILLSVELIYPFAGDLSIQPDEFRELIVGV